jgi:hypothetical protein
MEEGDNPLGETLTFDVEVGKGPAHEPAAPLSLAAAQALANRRVRAPPEELPADTRLVVCAGPTLETFVGCNISSRIFTYYTNVNRVPARGHAPRRTLNPRAHGALHRGWVRTAAGARPR